MNSRRSFITKAAIAAAMTPPERGENDDVTLPAPPKGDEQESNY